MSNQVKRLVSELGTPVVLDHNGQTVIRGRKEKPRAFEYARQPTDYTATIERLCSLLEPGSVYTVREIAKLLGRHRSTVQTYVLYGYKLGRLNREPRPDGYVYWKETE